MPANPTLILAGAESKATGTAAEEAAAAALVMAPLDELPVTAAS